MKNKKIKPTCEIKHILKFNLPFQIGDCIILDNESEEPIYVNKIQIFIKNNNDIYYFITDHENIEYDLFITPFIRLAMDFERIEYLKRKND